MSEELGRFEALSGAVFVATAVANTVVFGASRPHVDASAETVATYYQGHANAMRASAYLLVIAVIAGLYFYNVVRTYLSRVAEARRFADLAMLGAVIFGLDAVIEAGIQLSLIEMPAKLTAGSMQVLNILRNDMILPFQGVGVGLLLLSFSMAMWRSNLLPPWVTWFSVVLGLVAVVSFPLGLPTIAAGVWVVVVTIVLFRRLSVAEPSIRG